MWLHTNPERDPNEKDSIKRGLLSPVTSTIDDVSTDKTFTAKVEGDNVTITCYTMDNVEHSVTFAKPATIQAAEWLSGGMLKLYTVGGWAATPKWTFYTAHVDIPTAYKGNDSEDNPIVSYARDGSTLIAGNTFKSIPTLKAHVEIRGSDANRFGDSVSLAQEDGEDAPLISNWSKYIYLDATLAHDDGWNHALDQMDWPSAMQALGERTSMTIKFPSATIGEQDSTVLTLLDSDTKGSSGYVRVYRDYTDDDNRGAMIGAIQVGDWYSQGVDDAKSKFGLYGPGAASGLTSDEESYIASQSALAYNTIYEVYKTYDGSKNGDRKLFKTPVDRYNTGYDDAVATLAIDPSTNQSLGYSGSVTVKAKVKKRDGTYSEKSITVTAPADNSTSHSISITADKTNSYTEKGSDYTQIYSDVTFENQKWYRFEVDCGGTTKKYAIYVKTS